MVLSNVSLPPRIEDTRPDSAGKYFYGFDLKKSFSTEWANLPGAPITNGRNGPPIRALKPNITNGKVWAHCGRQPNDDKPSVGNAQSSSTTGASHADFQVSTLEAA